MNTSSTGFFASLSRRDFLVRTGLAAVGVSSVGQGAFGCKAAEELAVQVVIFSKAYQPLKLSFTEAAEFTGEAGLDGRQMRLGDRADAEAVRHLMVGQLQQLGDLLQAEAQAAGATNELQSLHLAVGVHALSDGGS